ncbi:hypothetical protein ZEAMMB73_Zm00001d002242 [Zea mays]|uniref:Uncharacterized protein n=1 Tax=Zea mays TaxID=4577 RepID=A0A1D6DYJ8_MAIZE|nr:hypothetical protein ZEAMMB73_Zm00001d002242 [Zea mays]
MRGEGTVSAMGAMVWLGGLVDFSPPSEMRHISGTIGGLLGSGGGFILGPLLELGCIPQFVVEYRNRFWCVQVAGLQILPRIKCRMIIFKDAEWSVNWPIWKVDYVSNESGEEILADHVSKMGLEKRSGQSSVFVVSTLMEYGGVPQSATLESLLKEAIHVISYGYEDKTVWELR